MNRVKADHYPDKICEVVYQGPIRESWKTRQNPDLPKAQRVFYPIKHRCQFSWYCDGKHDTPFQGKMWQESINLAKYVMKTPSLIDVTDGATHYHANYIPDPRWADPKKKTVAIDTHIFYRIYTF